MLNAKKFILDNKPLLYLTPIYFLLRLVFLTKIPIFNDEGIYLDWGWRMIHVPGQLFYSLHDAKQPFLFWIFGLTRSVISDPLVAGRLISVLTGLLTLVGLYFISKHFIDKKFAIIAPAIYVLIPLFSFFDRQALMESAVSAIAVWSCYFILSLLKKHSYIDVVILGVILGIGFFIKSTVLVFMVMAVVVAVVAFVTKKSKNPLAWRDIIFSLLVSQIALIPLYAQGQFWDTLSFNSQYSMTLSQLIHFPIKIWIQNLASFGEISFWHITPPLLFVSIIGMFLMLRKSFMNKILVFWSLGTILIFVLVASVTTVRYSVPFLPLVAVFGAYTLSTVYRYKKWISILLGIGTASCLIYFVFLQLVLPLRYFDALAKLTRFSQKSDYVTSWTAGYAVTDARNYIIQHLSEKGTIVGVDWNVGNPQNAIGAYFQDMRNVGLVSFDSGVFENIDHIVCFHSALPFYYVSREDQLVGLDKYVVEVKRFYAPEKQTFVGIYTLKTTGCKGYVMDLESN